MEEIRVGNYVRDYDGFIVKVNEIQEDTEANDIWYEEKTLYGTWKSMVVKHSPNIIDLIEVDDYVNGELITSAKYDLLINTDVKYEYEKTIESIVTHEQFKLAAYEV